MNEERVELPGGGVAWFTTLATHEQAMAIRKRRYRTARFLDRDNNWRENLTPEEHEAKDELLADLAGFHVRTLVNRWENVRAPNGDALTFPDGVNQMSEVDVQFLFDRMTAQEADPKSPPPSAPSSSRARSRRTKD